MIAEKIGPDRQVIIIAGEHVQHVVVRVRVLGVEVRDRHGLPPHRLRPTEPRELDRVNVGPLVARRVLAIEVRHRSGVPNRNPVQRGPDARLSRLDAPHPLVRIVRGRDPGRGQVRVLDRRARVAELFGLAVEILQHTLPLVVLRVRCPELTQHFRHPHQPDRGRGLVPRDREPRQLLNRLTLAILQPRAGPLALLDAGESVGRSGGFRLH